MSENLKPVAIYGPNFIDKFCTISVTSGDATKSYLYDGKTATQWQSSGSNDSTTETLTIEFKAEDGAVSYHAYDRIALFNSNIKAFDLHEYSASNVTNYTGASITSTAALYDVILTAFYSAEGYDVKKFVFDFKTTQTANQEKKIGELKICKSLIDLSNCLTQLSRTDEAKSAAYRTSSGGLVSWKEWTKFAAELSMQNVSQTDMDTLITACQNNTGIILVYEEDTESVGTRRIKAVDCFINNAPNFVLNRKTRLFETTLELRER